MEEEISLREIIETILAGKRIIIGVTTVAILIAALVSFFVLPDKYEATSNIVKKQPVTPPNVIVMDDEKTPAVTDGVDETLRSLINAQDASIEAYKDQVTNPLVLKQTIDEFNLKPEEYTIASLESMISTEVKDNLITIKVKGTDSKAVTAIADSVAKNFIEYVSDNNVSQLDDAVGLIGTEISKQEKDLDLAAEEYQRFLAQPGGVKELESENDAKLALLSDLKNQLTTNQIEIKQTEAALKQVEANLAGTPQTLVTKKTLADDAYLYEAAKSSAGTSIKDISGVKMSSEEISPVYTELMNEKYNLKKTLADHYAKESELKVQISLLQKELEQLQANLVEKQMQNDKLEGKVDILKNNYKLFSQRYEEAKLNKVAQSEENSFTLLGSAIEPEKPAGPHRLLNVAIAGILGIMLSTLFIFFREYWRNSAPTK